MIFFKGDNSQLRDKVVLPFALISGTLRTATLSTKQSRRTQNMQPRTIFLMQCVSYDYEAKAEVGSLKRASHSGPLHRELQEATKSL